MFALSPHCWSGRLILSNVKNAIKFRDESNTALAGLMPRLRISDEQIKEAHEAHCRFIRNGISNHAIVVIKQRQLDIDYLEHLEGCHSTLLVLVDAH